MPSKSKAQQKFMGMVHALKKGEIKPSDVSQDVRDAAKSMKKSDAKDFASTSHKGLPRKVKQEILNRLKEYANKMGRDHLGGDDYTSSKRGGLRDFDGYDNVDYNKDMPMDEGFKSEYKGNDGIIWKKGKSRGGVTNFTPYYKGHNIDVGGHNFKTEKELKDFIKNYILSNQLYNKYRYEGKLPNNWMSGRTSDYHTKLRGKEREYDDTNFEKDNSGQPDLEESFNELEHLKLLNLAMRTMPGSPKQKEIIRKLNKVRKAGGMKPLKEDLEDVIHQVKKFDKPKDEKLLTIKVINKLKDKRNKSKSSSNKQKLQKMIDKIEGDYKKGKYIKEYASNQTLSFLPLDQDEIDKMNEGTMVRRAVDLAQELLPKDTWSRYASDGKKNAEFVKNIVRDLARSLNQFYKNHNINVRIHK